MNVSEATLSGRQMVERIQERYTKPAKEKILRERGIDIDNLMTDKLANWEKENYIQIYKTVNGVRSESHKMPIPRPKFIVAPGDSELKTYIKEIDYYKRIGYKCLTPNKYGGYYIYSPIFIPNEDDLLLCKAGKIAPTDVNGKWEFHEIYAYSVKYFIEEDGTEIFPNVVGSRKVKNDPKNKQYEVKSMVVIYNHDLSLKDIKLPLEYCSAFAGGGYERYFRECGHLLIPKREATFGQKLCF